MRRSPAMPRAMDRADGIEASSRARIEARLVGGSRHFGWESGHFKVRTSAKVSQHGKEQAKCAKCSVFKLLTIRSTALWSKTSNP